MFYWIRIGVNLLAGGAAIATFLGFAGQLWWGFELLDHPRPQYSLMLLIAVIFGLVIHKHQGILWSVIWSIPLIVNIGMLLPLFIPAVAPSSATTTLRLLHANLDRDNLDSTRAIQYLDRQTVDLMFLQEVTPASLAQIQNRLKNYRIIAAEPRENSHGSAWLEPVSPTKLIKNLSSQIIHLPADSDRPLLQAKINLAGKEIVLLSYHVIRPRDAGTSAYQAVEFGAIAQWSQQIQTTGQRVIVIGDFNSTPTSMRFRKLVHQSGLVNSQRGFGLQPTWHDSFPSVLMIAIDHCLHSPSLTTIKREIGENIGSDHLPLWVELHLN
jgi:endonuclease/exonuclease/phosphatase (EEP) superfamily protein YafD